MGQLPESRGAGTHANPGLYEHAGGPYGRGCWQNPHLSGFAAKKQIPISPPPDFSRLNTDETLLFHRSNCYGPEFCGELKTKFVTKNIESIKLQNQGWKGAQLMGVGFKRVKLKSGHEIFAFEKLEKIIG